MSLKEFFTNCGRPSTAQMVWVALFGFSSGLAPALFRAFTLPAPVRWAICAFPVVFGILYLRALIRDMQKVDELQRRIWLEAMGVGALGAIALLLLYPTFQRAGIVGQLDPQMGSLAIVVLALIGYLNALRRYK